MDEVLFFYVGIALCVVVLAVSFVGMRSDKFPSPGMLKAGTLLVALIVAVTAFSAVKVSEAEQEHREEELNREAAAETEEVTEEQEATGEDSSSVATTGEPGAQVFGDYGCGGCHTLAALGDQATGTVGPNLDESLVDKDAAFTYEAIVAPSADIAPGFPDIMPKDYGSEISPEDLDALVEFLVEATRPSSDAAVGDEGGEAESGSASESADSTAQSG